MACLLGRAARRNHQAVTSGQAKSGPIIAAAASIMILVFGSFLLGGQRVLQEFGFGLGFAVLVDALVIRSLLVPALMHLTGPANWALPGWLDRILPRLAIEARDEASATRLGAAGTRRRPAETVQAILMYRSETRGRPASGTRPTSAWTCSRSASSPRTANH